ncbi:hypothetical protein [Cryobacterium zongtaii]|uniref:hypothetical protein n=1 Tax=Cryobacterium zongtaii TaxID=1259217 RepID=UPI001A9CD904|nr:hypothetical protein [Cryobacterium zongtaii]
MPTITIDSVPVVAFIDVFEEADLARDLGPRLTCGEAEALSNLLCAVGATAAADYWTEAHAATDEEGDSHCRPTEVTPSESCGIAQKNLSSDLDLLSQGH